MGNRLGKKAIGQSQSERAQERWIEQELAGCEFEDERLRRRFEKLFRQLSEGIGQSIPWACQDWSNTKAAYRFFANERVSESAILGGHFRATEKRLMSGVWPILMLHDTTELSFHRKDVAAVGMTTRVSVIVLKAELAGRLIARAQSADQERAASEIADVEGIARRSARR